MKKYLFLAAFLLGFLQTGQVFAVNDSCLRLFYHDEYEKNYDSVMVDTCKDSPTKGWWYAKKTYEFSSHYYFFHPKPLLEGEKYTWENVDTNFPAIRKQFQILKSKFGDYSIMRDPRAGDDFPYFLIEFNNYYAVLDVLSYLGTIDSVFHPNLLNRPENMSVEDVLKENVLIQNNGNILFIDFKNELMLKEAEISIIDVFGNIYNKSTIPSGTIVFSIDISYLSSGIYFIRIGNSIKKFVIVR